MRYLLRFIAALSLLVAAAAGGAENGGAIVVIAHVGVEGVDATTLQRLYTGRAIEIAGVPVMAVNLPSGDPVRERFLRLVLDEQDDHYAAYWTVRRHVGKGVPPRELKSAAEVIGFVRSTPGGVGYIAASDLRPGINVIFRP